MATRAYRPDTRNEVVRRYKKRRPIEPTGGGQGGFMTGMGIGGTTLG